MDPPAGASERTHLADRFDELWRTQETAPDVFTFLEASTAVTARDCVEVLLVDQAHRWQTGQPIPAERYLRALPEIAGDLELVLDLVWGECCHARRGRDNRPDVEQFIARFPELREALIRQAEVNDWWAGTAGGQLTGSEEGGQRARGDSSRGDAPPHPLAGATVPNQPSFEDLAPGLILGDYQLQDRIGRGGMGAVYRALHLRLGREVALKVIVSPWLSSPQVASRFYREMRAVGKLDHLHLVRATDARQVGERHLLVMELLDGLDLGRLTARVGPLPVAEACEMTRQAAEGLQHAHDHGIVHRDVKPSNLMLTPGGTIKLLDLGLARLQGEEMPDGITPSYLALGTPDYMPPEQALDSRAVSPRSDLYSLGCTLYHLLAGRPPFHGSGSPFGKMLGHQQAPIPPLRQRRPELPEGLVSVLDRMLAKDPAARPTSAREVAESLRPWCQGADLAALLDRALREGPVEPSRGALGGDSTVDHPEAVARSRDLPSTAVPPRRDEGASTGPAPAPTGRRAGRWRRATPALVVAAILVLLGLPVAWRLVRPDPRTIPTPIKPIPEKPLKIVSLTVYHYGVRERVQYDFRPIGPGGEPVRVGDDVRVELEFSEPAYAYLLALNTDGKVELCLPEGFDLRLMSWGDGTGVPTSGNNLVIVGTDDNNLLHIRIFDPVGRRVTDTDETTLPPAQAQAILTLKQQLPDLLPPHVMTDAEKAQVLREATSIVGQTPPEGDDQAPPRAARLVLYPNHSDYFTLTEGPGVQAFVVVARRGPTPPYRASGLKAALEQLWTHVEAPRVWRYDGEQFTPELPPGPESRVGLGGTRGEKTRRVPEPFVRACQYLRDRHGVEAVAAVAFPVTASAAKPSGP
jgi:serine/threonine protein kinase